MIMTLFDRFTKAFRAGSPASRTLQEASEHERRLIELCSAPARDALAALETRFSGLSSEEAEKRLDEYGPNELSHTRRLGFWADIFQRCKGPLVIQLLLIASI